MPDNDLVDAGGATLQPWGPNEPVDHRRLNDMQARPVYNVTVRGKGARVVRTGGTVAILLKDQNSAGVGLKLLHITGNRTGGGKYEASVLGKPESVDSTTDVSTDDFGDPTDADATAVNLLEHGLNTHKLTHANNTIQTYCFGLPWGSDDDGRACYLIAHFWTKACT